MRLYRVFPFEVTATADQPGGPLFAPTSHYGRFDNPERYQSFYASLQPFGAIIERCGEFTVPWRAEHFLAQTPFFDAPLPLALAEYEAEISLVDLDLVRELAAEGVERATDVITRDRARTQAIALQIFLSRRDRSAGLSWWSYYDPAMGNAILWDPSALRVLAITPLAIDTPIVRETAARYFRTIEG